MRGRRRRHRRVNRCDFHYRSHVIWWECIHSKVRRYRVYDGTSFIEWKRETWGWWYNGYRFDRIEQAKALIDKVLDA